MNILEAFNKIAENHKITIKLGDTRFINIEGIIYRSLNYSPYSNIGKEQDAFNYEEILSNNWEVVE